jgi:hypothetical protein
MDTNKEWILLQFFINTGEVEWGIKYWKDD